MIGTRLFEEISFAASRERRLHRRIPIPIQIELRPKHNPVPIRLKTSDISVGGCYVEMGVTLEPGTSLDIVLWLEHEKMSLEGTVATKHPHFGNGIEFVAVPPQLESRLQQFVEQAESSKII